MTDRKGLGSRGPLPDLKKDRQVLKYRKLRKPKSFRWISQEIGEDVKNVHTRYKRALASFPQV